MNALSISNLVSYCRFCVTLQHRPSKYLQSPNTFIPSCIMKVQRVRSDLIWVCPVLELQHCEFGEGINLNSEFYVDLLTWNLEKKEPRCLISQTIISFISKYQYKFNMIKKSHNFWESIFGRGAIGIWNNESWNDLRTDSIWYIHTLWKASHAVDAMRALAEVLLVSLLHNGGGDEDTDWE